MTSDPLQRFSDGVVRLRPLDVADAALVADDLALELFRPTELVIRVHKANTASSAVPERLGFTFSHHTAAADDGEGELDWYVLKA